MGKKDDRVDAYIEKAPAFAKPLLTHFRELVHDACPGILETIKWNCPHFELNGIVCSMASFKHHCGFAFKSFYLFPDELKAKAPSKNEAAGQLGKIKNLSELPHDKILKEFIKEGARLNEIR